MQASTHLSRLKFMPEVKRLNLAQGWIVILLQSDMDAMLLHSRLHQTWRCACIGSHSYSPAVHSFLINSSEVRNTTSKIFWCVVELTWQFICIYIIHMIISNMSTSKLNFLGYNRRKTQEDGRQYYQQYKHNVKKSHIDRTKSETKFVMCLISQI